MSKYQELVQRIENAPRTQLAALIAVVVRVAYERGALVPGRASFIVARVEAELGREGERDE